MDQIWNFICNHWRLLLEVVILLISFIICLIRKRPVYNEIDNIKMYILQLLPGLISKVESPGNGEQKKSSVLSLIHLLVKNKFGFDCSSLDDFINQAIEDILSTPTKHKEVN